MTYDPTDKRALFQRVVDDILDRIRAGTLNPGDRLPSAKEISEGWDVSAMTAQRALRELQALGLSYGMAGKGSFVHPDATDRIKLLDGQPVRTRDGITVSAPLAKYLRTRDTLATKASEWLDNLHDKPKAAQLQAEMHLLSVILEDQRQQVDQAEIDRYQTELNATAGPDTQPPATETPETDDRRRTTK
ncbi:DNA-binding transcriptional regulator YhcF (GntR family) [Catenuloplanes nepalensis]|uniref:DNA-binding transcriptional regulator YhcF (GntR family) n=1 Tax=Catenuloplanes nepalensis TaxID=587533 RepID=A0ABT9MQM3_9ACTN|nr:GntR family transcriptional regulator [Catenuloplanes nepalensis]MDP9793710.1 DNA-binding transcriptional regulator YhcF (GntR family) [Catenuloplanes nepalensis]